MEIDNTFKSEPVTVAEAEENATKEKKESSNKETKKNGPDNAGKNKGQTLAIPGWEKLIHLTNENYQSIFLDHKNMFVMFHAKWCNHCTLIKPIFAELASSLQVNTKDGATGGAPPSPSIVATIAACDTDAAPSLVDEFQLVMLPTFKYVRNGKAIREYGGDRTKEGFVEFLQRMSEEKDEE